jgi:hypothetical protein
MNVTSFIKALTMTIVIINRNWVREIVLGLSNSLEMYQKTFILVEAVYTLLYGSNVR